MEQRIKEYSLNRFFMTFLAHAVLSFLLVAGLWVCLLIASTALHLVLPANAVEQAVSFWQSSLDRHTALTPGDIPEGAGYAFFDTDGRLLSTNLTENSLNDAGKLAVSEDQINILRSASGIYLRIDTDTQRVIVSYRLMASFRPPILRRLFPNAELFFLVLLLLLLIADFIFIALRYARKLSGELQKLATAADRIKEQNLVFTVPKTKVSEFNRIMDSLELLRTNLQSSLKEQWAMQQQKKSQFTALAHDIKTPLAIVSGNAELLAETDQTAEQKEYTAFILEHTAQIHRYVTGMLTLSKPDSSAQSTCEIKKLLSAAAKDVESLGQKKHLACLLQMEDLPSSLSLPCDDIRRILANLTDNAVQYSPENGTVYLLARLTDDTFTLCVRDEGEGFSKEALSLAAAEFYRGDKSRSSKEHFGLGLFITRQIVTKLNGTLHLENAPEKGALVTVSIPVGKKAG